MINKEIKISKGQKKLELTKPANYFITVSDLAEVKITEDFGDQQDLNLKIELVLMPGAKVDYRIRQNSNTDSYQVERVAEVGREAVIHWHEVQLGSQVVKSSITNSLSGEGAEAYINGVYFGNENQKIELTHVNKHLASHTKSDILTKGALTDKALAEYKGLVKVGEGAANCQGYQKQETLLLSEQAQINPVPDLEIANNDVKCSHGVTVSHLDEERLFYLKSRGLNHQLAVFEFVNGFLNSAGFELDEAALSVINQKIK